MPFLRLTLRPNPPEDVALNLARDLTDLMRDVLAKNAELTSVVVEGTSKVWTIGMQECDVACHLEATITAGTNDGAQKARFIHEAMQLLKKQLGTIHPASYVAISEIPATDWGYDCRTQASRQ